jgi:hypothetical protein
MNRLMSMLCVAMRIASVHFVEARDIPFGSNEIRPSVMYFLDTSNLKLLVLALALCTMAIPYAR